jgi:phospholipid/cholesterol/gamma-HCH transport system permease protein
LKYDWQATHQNRQVSLMLKGMFTKPENFKMYWKEFMHQASEIGIGRYRLLLSYLYFLAL